MLLMLGIRTGQGSLHRLVRRKVLAWERQFFGEALPQAVSSKTNRLLVSLLSPQSDVTEDVHLITFMVLQ
jgi:hypothetical protein